MRKALLALPLLIVGLGALTWRETRRLGKQADGSFVVSTGQAVASGAIAFRGRPADMAMHPRGGLYAVLNKNQVFLLDAQGVREGSALPLKSDAAFHGIAWTPDGSRLIAGTAEGKLRSYSFDGTKLTPGNDIEVSKTPNPVPGGMAITRDGKTLFVTAANLNAVVEIDLNNDQVKRTIPVETLPYEVKLTPDENTLVVSNWGGKLVPKGARWGKTQDMEIEVDERGAPSSGTVSIIDRASLATRSVQTGIHPCAIVTAEKTAYVANAMSDSISVIDLAGAKVDATIPIRRGKNRLIGSMPNALALRGDTLYACNGGDNAVCEIDLKRKSVKGFRPAGYFPIAISLEGDTAFVLNSKGNGSVQNTAQGRAGNAHDFQGTVSKISLNQSIDEATKQVASLNNWDKPQERPKLAVYNGAIQHVIYIIKENRTYDEVFGDLPQGNGDKRLCSLGAKVMPNHQKLAKQFTLFDNGYVSGTNSADGHQWSTQALANDYLEKFYVGYSRSYPDDGDEAMAISNGGCLWDAAAKKKKTVRVYGEFADDALAEYIPRRPADWFEAWEDRKNGTNKFKYVAHTRVKGLEKYLCPDYHYWPLIQSDQARADVFINEYNRFSKQNKVPNLMILSLPSDHSEGADPAYPTPRAMMADNDLALGRIVEAVSKSKEWKNTCIFVIEDDAQSGPDHVDGHRTVYMAISPYNRMGTVDSNLYTTTHMIRSIEMMLGLDPMNRFDYLANPIDGCFRDEVDLKPYIALDSNIPLDESNPGRKKPMTKDEKYWADLTKSLDWSHLDGPDPDKLNRIIWASQMGNRPYPVRD